MEYTVNELAKLSGVSPRTLRYYDSIGLLRPERIGENGYRIYGAAQVDALQQILFYRALGFALNDIAGILSAPDYDRERALKGQLDALRRERERTDALIRNVENTLSAMKGETEMSDGEKFEGLKREAIAKNEREYGAEIREKYGDGTVDKANAKLSGMSSAEWDAQKALEAEIKTALAEAVRSGDPASPTARHVCELHGKWLRMMWPDGMYTPEAHRGMAEMYVADERFARYYDSAAGDGAAKFLREAIMEYTKAK